MYVTLPIYFISDVSLTKQPESKFPAHADSLIRNYMHSHDVFCSEDGEDTILKIINPLRKGTEIEEQSASQYNTLKERIKDRINDLAEEMQTGGFLERGPDRRLRRVEHLEIVWKDRHTLWEKHNQEPSQAAPLTTSDSAVQPETSTSSSIQAGKDTTPWTFSAKSVDQTRVPKVLRFYA